MAARRRNFPVWYGCRGILAAVALLATAVPASAQDLYAVSGIAVDETAASEVEAKQLGVANAKRAALAEVIRRITLVPPDPLAAENPPTVGDEPDVADIADLPSNLDPIDRDFMVEELYEELEPTVSDVLPDDERLEFLLRDVSFQEEKFGGGRYLAEMTVRFQPDAVNLYLQRSGVPYVGSASPTVVVLPIFRDLSGDRLWSETNPWLAAWWEMEGSGTVVPFTIPLGDLSDIAAIDVSRALAVDPRAINAIAARYRAGAVAVAIATFATDGALLVELSTFGTGWPNRSELLTFRLSPPPESLEPDLEDPDGTMTETASADVPDPESAETTAQLIVAVNPAEQLDAAAQETLVALERRWKSGNLLRFDQDAAALTASVELYGLEDWLSVRAGLDRTAPIKSWKLSELTTSRAVVEIDYVGETDRLRQELARSALGLEAGADADAWVLTRR